MKSRRIRKLPQRAGKDPDADAVRGESLEFVDLASRHRNEEDRKEREDLAREERLTRLRGRVNDKDRSVAGVAHEVANLEDVEINEAEEVELFEASKQERRVFSTSLQQEVASLNTKRIRWFERGGVLVAVGTLVLGFVLLLVYIAQTDRNIDSSESESGAVNMAAVNLDTASHLSNARRVSRNFVLAKSQGERLKYVRFPGKVAELMLKDKSMNWDAPLPVSDVLAYGSHLYEEPFFLGCYVELDPTKIYQLEFQSVENVDDLLSNGRNTIVIAMVDGRLHIRIFGVDGSVMADKGELELAAGNELLSLKDEMKNSPIPSADALGPETRDETIKNALFAAGFSEPRKYPIEVEMTSEGSLVDWGAFAEYNEIPWPQLLEERPNEKDVAMRVVATLDDYYNYQFTEDKYTCFKVQNRDRNLGMYAYAPKKGWVELELRKFLKDKITYHGVGAAEISFPQVKVRFPKDRTPEPMAEITAFVAPDWLTVDPMKDESDMVSPRAIVGGGADDEMPLKMDSLPPLAPRGSWRE
ncbi:MAG: hypothetical protein ACI9R3_004769 [Verrucomicrobiales bacterium]|jgi:hypothetical protein